MALIGSIPTVRAQAAQHPFFKTTFAYLDEVLRAGTDANKRMMSVPFGESQRIELGDGVFALEQSYNSKPHTEGKWESHLRFIDVQVLVSGEEIMEVCEISRLSVSENLTPAKDLIFYKECDDFSAVRMHAGEAAILFPVDGHKPGIAVSSPVPVRKIVVKVPVI